MLLLLLVMVLLAMALINNVKMHRLRFGVMGKLSGPICFPLLGAFQMFLNVNSKNFLQRGAEVHARYGKIVTAWICNRIAVSSIDVELNEQILSNHQQIAKHPNYKMLHQWLGEGLLVSSGPKWALRRKIITPAFHIKILEQFVEIFDQQSSVLVECLAPCADGRSAIDVHPYICAATLDIIAETAMGTKLQAQTNASAQYAKAVNDMTELLAFRFMKFLQNELIFSILCPHLKLKQQRLVKILHEFTTNVIKQRRQALTATLEQDTATEVTRTTDHASMGMKKRMALLDVLLQSAQDGAPLSDEDIREEVDTFMFEGHDTTAAALGATLHLLARHDAVQQKLRAEVLSVLGEDRARVITMRDLGELKYMECVLKEALRLYPSVPVVGRQLTQEMWYTHSKLGAGSIPAGVEFLINLYGMMRDPQNFSRPNDFVPERHLNGEPAGAYLMIPFSAGPRNCIGQKFAMLEMKTIIAKLVREYELLPLGEPLQLEVNIVLRSGNGYQLGLRRRVEGS